jgi:hypothetical protein
MSDIDFLPASYHESKSRARRARREAMLVALAIAGLFVGWWVSRDSNEDLRHAVMMAESQAARAATEAENAAKLTLAKQRLEAQVALQHKVTQPVTAAQIIAAIARATPTAVTAQRLTLISVRPTMTPKVAASTKEATKSSKHARKEAAVAAAVQEPDLIRVEFTGVAAREELVGQFTQKLSENPLFVSVKLGHSRALQSDELVAREFRVTLEVPLDRVYRSAVSPEVAIAH